MTDDSLYIDQTTLRDALAISRRTAEERPLRAALAEAIAGILRGMGAIVDAARRFDRRAYEDLAEVEVDEPVFIVAAPRSGTTFLHRLMCLDRRFFHLKLYQTLLPAVSLFRLIDTADGLDTVLGEPLASTLDRLEAVIFGGWEEIHPLGFDRAEEDEGLFVLTLLSAGLYLLFPEIDELPRPWALDDLEGETRRRVMDFYEGSLARVKYVEGREKRFLGKTVLVPGRLHSLLERFPDARFIHLVRHPYRTVPSFVSMFRRPWYTHSPDIADDSPETRRLADLVIDYYRRMHAAKSQLGDSQVTTVAFDDLVDEPKGTIERLYDWLDLRIRPDFEWRLDAELRERRDYSSSHDYSLEQFGLTRAEIRDRLPEIFEAHGFEP